MYRLMICLALFAPTLAAQATVSSVFNDPVTGKITELDVQGRINVDVEDSDVPERVPLDEIEEITFPYEADEVKPDEAPLRVYLVNGDMLRGKASEGPADNDEEFVLSSDRFGELTINVRDVRRLEVVKNVRPDVLPDLQDEAESDVTYFAAQDGSPADVGPRSELVRVVNDGLYVYSELLDEENYDGVKYAWDRLRGVVCLRDEHEPHDELMGVFTLRDGSVIRGAIEEWNDGRIGVDHLVLDATITLNEANLMSVILKNGRYAYLSDMDFAETPEERPYYLPSDFDYENYLFKVKRDRAQGGGPISINGRMYAKGLGVHAISRLSFSLNRGYKRFVADVGVDDSAGENGSVVFKVYADGELVYESDTLRGTAPAKSIDVDVLNVNELVLEVTAAGDDDVYDRANWGGAKVVR